MKKIAILVIAAINQPVYIHYIRSYWTALIRHLRVTRPHIDVFLLFENHTDLEPFHDLQQYIIRDPLSDFSKLCDPKFHNLLTPGILSKTLHAFELLQDRYDVFFRTNLSSMIRVPVFDQFIQEKEEIRYSGGLVWSDSLRKNLLANQRVGPGQSIKTLAELDSFPGNTFVSGSGFLISAAEAKSLVQRKHEFRYDIADDVSVGLMMAEHEFLPGFSQQVSPRGSLAFIKCLIRKSNAPHIRLTRFPLEKAQALWAEMQNGQLWQVPAPPDHAQTRYRMHFPVPGDESAASKEMHFLLEGLRMHPRVKLVNKPESADYLVFCQSHFHDHYPSGSQFRAIKEQHKNKSILMDFDDDPGRLCDGDVFGWALYFKSNCLDGKTGQPVDYGELPVIPTACGVLEHMIRPPADYNGNRSTALSCLFSGSQSQGDTFQDLTEQLRTFAHSLANRLDYPIQVGLEAGDEESSGNAIDDPFKRCIYNSKILVMAHAGHCVDDTHIWEAISSGALVFVNRLKQTIPFPLIDGKHLIFYDPDTRGLEELEHKILYYLENDEERARIGLQGREFVYRHHRGVNRINEVICHLDAHFADKSELEAILEQEKKFRSSGSTQKPHSEWQTPDFGS